LQQVSDDVVDGRLSLATIDHQLRALVFKGRPTAHGHQSFSHAVERQAEGLRQQVRRSAQQPALQADEGERVVYQRILGHPEVADSHRWTEQYAPQCHVCSKQTHCLVVWNKKLAQHGSNRPFFDHADLEAVKMAKLVDNGKELKYDHPVLCYKEEVRQMMTLHDFMRRLKHGRAKERSRACNNELESAKAEIIR